MFYVNCCNYTNIDDNFKVLKRCKLQNLFSLESMVIEEENPILNTQITLNSKRTVLSIYQFKCFKYFCYNLVVKFCSVNVFTIYNY